MPENSERYKQIEKNKIFLAFRNCEREMETWVCMQCVITLFSYLHPSWAIELRKRRDQRGNRGNRVREGENGNEPWC